MSGHGAPPDRPRQDDIAAAIAAHNNASPDLPLRSAARLLAVMFSAGDLCMQSWETMAAEGFSREDLKATLRQLVAAGFLSKEPRIGRAAVTYRLHLPPVRP